MLYSKYTTEERIFEKNDTLNRTSWALWTNKTKKVWIFCLSSLFDIFIWYKPKRPFSDAKKNVKRSNSYCVKKPGFPVFLISTERNKISDTTL